MQTTVVADERQEEMPIAAEEMAEYRAESNLVDLMEELTKKMAQAAENLEFEKAAGYRDEIARLQAQARENEAESAD